MSTLFSRDWHELWTEGALGKHCKPFSDPDRFVLKIPSENSVNKFAVNVSNTDYVANSPNCDPL